MTTSMTTRGLITDIDILRERCRVDPATHCWHWLGGCTGGHIIPAIWAFDHDRCEKRTMSGPLAVWNIAHGASPMAGKRVFRACQNRECLNPAHLRQGDQVEIGLHQRRMGSRKGKASDTSRHNLHAAWAALGIVLTPDAVVRAIRSADPIIRGVELAALHGIAPQTVSRIRGGHSHRWVTA